MPEAAALMALARRLLPAGCAVSSADPTRHWPLLSGEALPGATPRRLAEFSAGRHAARSALRTLGLPLTAIPMGDDRSPLWPEGIAGTISHDRTACLAAVRRGEGIGIDLEEEDALPEDLWKIVLLPEERHWVDAQPQSGLAATVVFSAKEAAYKAQYPASRVLFGFDRLMVSLTAETFTATFRAATGPFRAGHQLHGRWGRAAGHVLTTVAI